MISLFDKDTPTHVFCCEISEIFKNTHFEEHLRTTTSEKVRNMFKTNDKDNRTASVTSF